MADLEKLQDEITESIGLIEATREALEAAAEEVPKLCLPRTGGTLTGNLDIDATTITLQKHNSVGFSTLLFMNKDSQDNEMILGASQNVWAPEATFTRQLHKALAYTDDGVPVEATVEAVAYKDGRTCGMAPHPQASDYAKQIVTMKTLKDYASQRMLANVDIHVGGDNASDTADLNAGRGGESMPFATPEGALTWATANYAGRHKLIIHLHDDFVMPQGYTVSAPGLKLVEIKGDGQRRTLTLGGNIAAENAVLYLSNLKLKSQGKISRFVWAGGAFGYSFIQLGDIEFEGEADTTVLATWGGVIQASGPFTGTVTGKRYTAYKGSKILTGSGAQDLIPGSINGECDASSVYA